MLEHSVPSWWHFWEEDMEPYEGAALLEETHYLGMMYRLSSLPGQFLSFPYDEM